MEIRVLTWVWATEFRKWIQLALKYVAGFERSSERKRTSKGHGMGPREFP